MPDATPTPSHSPLTTPQPRPPMLEDFIMELVWPKLLRAGGLALRPDRVGLGMVAVVLLSLLGRLPGIGQDAAEGTLLTRFTQWWRQLANAVQIPVADATERADRAAGVLRAAPDMLHGETWIWLVLVLPMLWVWAVLGGAISRSAMSEVALSRTPDWPKALGQAVRLWSSLLGALLLPLITVGVLWGMIAVGGLLAHVPVLDVVASVFFGLALIFGVLSTLVLVAYGIGGWTLIPAVMAESTDALDGVQRSLAYVWAKPLRSVGYLLTLMVVGVVVITIAAWIAMLGDRAATWAAMLWGPTDSPSIWSGPVGSSGVAASVLGFWRSVLWVVVAGYAVSYVHTASGVLYLCMRRVCDGQEIGELWESDRVSHV